MGEIEPAPDGPYECAGACDGAAAVAGADEPDLTPSTSNARKGARRAGAGALAGRALRGAWAIALPAQVILTGGTLGSAARWGVLAGAVWRWYARRRARARARSPAPDADNGDATRTQGRDREEVDDAVSAAAAAAEQLELLRGHAQRWERARALSARSREGLTPPGAAIDGGAARGPEGHSPSPSHQHGRPEREGREGACADACSQAPGGDFLSPRARARSSARAPMPPRFEPAPGTAAAFQERQQDQHVLEARSADVHARARARAHRLRELAAAGDGRAQPGTGTLSLARSLARELVLAQSDAEAPLDGAALDDGRRVQGDALDELSDGFEAEIAGIVEGVAEHIRRRLESLGEFGEELATDPVLGLSILTGGQGHDLACERSWPSDASDAGSDASGVDDEDGLTPFSSTPAPTGARAS